jgi:hypothetical protein
MLAPKMEDAVLAVRESGTPFEIPSLQDADILESRSGCLETQTLAVSALASV